jgi:PAS domain S-box-containing protein
MGEKSLNILVIEDDSVFTTILSQMLRLDFSAQVTVVRDSDSALRALESGGFDLITLDYRIYGGDGLELLEKIRRDPASPPVIMVTGHGDEDIASKAFQLGAAGYVVKDGRASAILPETVKIVLEREAYRQAIEASERKFRLLAENTSDNIWIVDLDFNTIYTSPSVERMLGYTPEEIMALPTVKYIEPEYLAKAFEARDAELQKEREGADPDRSITIDLRQRRKDGTLIWTEASITFLRDETGTPTAVLGVTRDITEQKNVIEALRESEERFRILVANIPELLWTTDLQLNFTYVSPMVERMGYTVEEAMALSLDGVATPESFEAAADLLSRELEIADETIESAATVFELELINKDGTTFAAEVSAGFLRDAQGKPYALLGTARPLI